VYITSGLVKMTNLKIYLLLFVQYVNVSFVISLSDVTDKVFSKRPTGLIAAFGDFNADKYTDVFVISDNGENQHSRLLDYSRTTFTRYLGKGSLKNLK
jgi:integrin alpha FG-GAP repeat containing protein 1